MSRQSRIRFGSFGSGSQWKDTYHEGQKESSEEACEESREEEEEVVSIC
jgi:hypothetical protein